MNQFTLPSIHLAKRVLKPMMRFIEVGLTSINYVYCECDGCDGCEITIPLPLSNFYSVIDTIYA
ncbi:MAG: hypothetical protein M3M88_04540 [Thermoproteota archaeon]|nr:hypothetical protein [Thermoproteota archaeon]